MVNLARLTGAHDLLPMALVDCCRLGPELVYGVVQPDGTRVHLSTADLALCFQAKDKLIQARVRAFSAILKELQRMRTQGELCTDERGDDLLDVDRLQEDMLDGELPALCTPNVWDSLTKLVIGRASDELCQECKTAITEAELLQQEATFERLPELVGVTVEGWGKDTSSKK